MQLFCIPARSHLSWISQVLVRALKMGLSLLLMVQAIARGKIKNMVHLKGIDRPGVCNPNNQSDFGYQTFMWIASGSANSPATHFDIKEFDHESFDSFYQVQWQVGAAKFSLFTFEYSM